MKCEHCGRNEATFFYKSSVNGRVTQVHLCQDCARRMGYTDSLRRSMQPMSLFGDGFFGSAFSLLEPFMDGFGTRMLTEFPSRVSRGRRRKKADLWTRRSRTPCAVSAGAMPCRSSLSPPWKAKTTRRLPACGMSFVPCPGSSKGKITVYSERKCSI